tara:strand:+ start:25 stop:408 length:384 start_codon:yes stop_codon:yes gene_type:complete
MPKEINPKLTVQQKKVMFEEGTETPGSSELNFEKREGAYYCANCDKKLFESNTKYESGSGWPSFYEASPEAFDSKTDYLIGYARTEYHCKNCGVHHGHIFDDGPKPTGKRYCNNGICLVFRPNNIKL